MKKNTWITVAIIATVVIIIGYLISSYNSLARLGQDVDAKWANVEATYQRRANLIPNLVSTVKGYAKHEQETLDQVVAARTNALAGNTDSKKFAAAQQQVSSAIGRLIAIAESYPTLKADKGFLELQAQLEGSENRITVAIKEFNEMVKKYNTKTVTFPSNIIANMFGFEKKELFSAEEGSEIVPQVEF